MKKKGLSNVVATVLIVLLALAAVAIVWGFLGPTIRGGGDAITLRQKCITIEVKPTSCTYTTATQTAVVNVQHLSGDPTNLIGIIEMSDGSTQSAESAAPASPLATVPFSFNPVATAPIRGRAASLVQDPVDSAKEEICPESTITVDCTVV